MKIILLITALTLSSYFRLNSQITTTTFNTSKDSYTISSSTSNFGTNVDMHAGITSKFGVASFRRSYLYFPITGIPANAIVTAAKIMVYQTGGTTASSTTELLLERITQSWVETTVASGTEPNVSTSGVIQNSFYATSTALRTFYVKDHAQKMVNGFFTNEGWRIRYYDETQTTANNFIFHTREGVNDPVLEISYYIPKTISSATINHCSTTASSDGSITPTFVNGSGGTYTYQWINSAGSTVGTSSSLSGVPYGWYGLYASDATNNDHFYMAFLVGVNCQNVSIDFKPGPNYIDDAQIADGTNSGNNYGSGLRFPAQTNTNGVVQNLNNYVKFRLWMDQNLTVSQADLYLSGKSHTSGGLNAASLLKTTSNWGEFSISWLNQPTYSSSIQENIPATTSTTESKTVNLINFWNAWKTDNTLNYGMRFQLQNATTTTRRMEFHSSDATTDSLRPRIYFNVGLVNMTGCQPITIGDISYSQLKSQLDGGYATTFLNKLKFAFKEESGVAASKYIPYEIRDKDNVVIAGSDLNGTTFGGAPALVYSIDDNNHILDLSGISSLTTNTYYTLEVITTNGTRKKLRFFYGN